MTHEPFLAKRAANALADDAALRASEGSVADDPAMIDALATAIVREARKRRVRRAGIAAAGALAIAASVAVVFHVRAPAQPSAVGPKPAGAQVASLADGASIVRAGVVMRVDDRTGIEGGDRVVTARGARAAVTLLSGTHLVVDEEADVEVRSLDAMHAFDLRAGSVRADVAKLRLGERFVIRTADAEVEVRGTSFRVSIVAPDPSCRGGTITRVQVMEGDVVVRAASREEHVLANGAWPAECISRATAAAPLPATVPAAPPVSIATASPSPEAPTAPPSLPSLSTATTVATARGATTAPTVRPASETSDLAAQNALFSDATAARRRGDAAQAIARYEELARRYPSSPLAEGALVERMRLLSARDERAAALAAREYLALHPHGFARDEAARLASHER